MTKNKKNRTPYYKFGHGNWLTQKDAFAKAKVNNTKDLFEKYKPTSIT